MPHIIKVNRNVLARNAKQPDRCDPPLTNTVRNKSWYGQEISVCSTAGHPVLWIRYRPEGHADHGSVIWMEVFDRTTREVQADTREGTVILGGDLTIIVPRLNGDERDPVIQVHGDHGVVLTRSIRIIDVRGNVACELVHNPDKPKDCGAIVWVEVPVQQSVEVWNQGRLNPMPGSAIHKGQSYENWLEAEGMAGFEATGTPTLEAWQ